MFGSQENVRRVKTKKKKLKKELKFIIIFIYRFKLILFILTY